MLSNLFTSILTEGTFTGTQLGIVTITSLVCGLIIAISYSIKNKCSRSFAVTLVLLSAIVELVIILVNGNIGAGVAVAGAFSLVRFRSAPGTAREIGAIFLAAVAILPTIVSQLGGLNFHFGGTSLLIAVGVALDTMKQLENQMVMRNYSGFLK